MSLPRGYSICTARDSWSKDKGDKWFHWDVFTEYVTSFDSASYKCPHCGKTFLSGDWRIKNRNWQPDDDPASRQYMRVLRIVAGRWPVFDWEWALPGDPKVMAAIEAERLLRELQECHSLLEPGYPEMGRRICIEAIRAYQKDPDE